MHLVDGATALQFRAQSPGWHFVQDAVFLNCVGFCVDTNDAQDSRGNQALLRSRLYWMEAW